MNARLFLFLVAFGSACLGIACSNRDGGHGTGGPSASTSPAVDEELLAYLSLARSAHHKANLHEEAGDLAAAVKDLDAIVNATKPPHHEGAPEVKEVLADAFARKADLLAQQGDVAGADTSVKAGLAYAPTPGYFRARLLEASGVALETKVKQLEDAGKKHEATKARDEAVRTLEEADRKSVV